MKEENLVIAKRVKELETRLQDLEQYFRDNSIEINDVPEN